MENDEDLDSISPEQEIDFCTLGMFIVGKIAIFPMYGFLASLTYAVIEALTLSTTFKRNTFVDLFKLHSLAWTTISVSFRILSHPELFLVLDQQI